MNYEPCCPMNCFRWPSVRRASRNGLGFLEVVRDAGDEPRRNWSDSLREAIDDLSGLTDIETDLDDSLKTRTICLP